MRPAFGVCELPAHLMHRTLLLLKFVQLKGLFLSTPCAMSLSAFPPSHPPLQVLVLASGRVLFLGCVWRVCLSHILRDLRLHMLHAHRQRFWSDAGSTHHRPETGHSRLVLCCTAACKLHASQVVMRFVSAAVIPGQHTLRLQCTV